MSGHNSSKLRSLVERIERLEEERKTLGADVKEVYAEVKSQGYDSKTVRRLIKKRKHDPADLEAQDALLEVYEREVNSYDKTPLGAAAMERVAAHA
jgi:uncharacterized protein (UPF0335 family)